MKQLMIGLSLIALLLSGCGSSDDGTDKSAASLTPPQPQGAGTVTVPPSPPSLH